jgi:hypothetical protein
MISSLRAHKVENERPGTKVPDVKAEAGNLIEGNTDTRDTTGTSDRNRAGRSSKETCRDKGIVLQKRRKKNLLE